MGSRLRRRRAAFRRELAQRGGRVAKPELGDLDERRREPGKRTLRFELPDRANLGVRRSAGADEIGVVRVGDPVRPGAGLGDDGVLVERERRVARAHQRQRVGDRLGALRVGGRVAPPVANLQQDVLLRRDSRDQLGPGDDSRSGSRGAASAARSPSRRRGRRRAGTRCRQQALSDDPLRRRLERRVRARTRTPARTSTWSGRSPPGTWIWYRVAPLEGVLPVRPDLGLDAECPQEAERAAGRPPTRRRRGGPRTRRDRAGGGCPAVWKSPESSARRSQSRCGSIAASSRRTSSESGTFELQQPSLVLDPERAVAADPAGGDDAVAREDQRQPVLRAERARPRAAPAAGRRARRARRS